MSIEPNEKQGAQTPEERFFGMNSVIDTDGPSADDDPIEIESEIESDDPEKPAKAADSQPKPRAKAEADDNDDDDLDTEMEGYGERVKKRIAKLTWEKNEERRQREAIEKERTEALNFSKQVLQKNQQYEDLIHNGEATLIANMRAAVEAKLAHFEQQYRKAYEEGDTDAIINAQKEYFRAEAEQGQLNQYANDYQLRSQQYQAFRQQQARQPQPPPPAAPTVPKPSQKSLQWAKQNPWFGSQKDMTALAYGVHEKLVEQEYDPNSDEYFEEIDREIRRRFPEYFDEEQGHVAPASTHRKPKTVVAAGDRNNGTKTRKVKLTPTALSVARQLGLTPEQYAREQQALSERGNVNG